MQNCYAPMASVHKQPRRQYWYCAFIDHAGKRRFVSTKTTDRKEAERICGKQQEIADKGRNGRITEDRARKIIENAVADILEASGARLERQTIAEHFYSWIKARSNVSSDGTFKRYSGVVTQFLT